MIDTLKSRLRSHPFIANLVTVMTGAALAQAIPLLVLPIVSRLYSKEEYGVYSLFLLVAYTASAFASLRFELAIMLPKIEVEAANLMLFCCSLAVAVSLLAQCVVGLVVHSETELPQFVRIGSLLPAVPLMVLALSLNQSGYYWLLRRQDFKHVSANRILRSVSTSVISVILGLLHFEGGLAWAAIVGQLVAVGAVARWVWMQDGALFRTVTLKGMFASARPHAQFPLYALPADLLSTYSQQLPLLFFPTKEAGAFSLVQNSIGVPLNFITATVLDVFKERATRDYREGGRFDAIFRSLLKSLLLLGVIPMVVLMAWGDELFTFAFGESWRLAGEYAQVMAFMLVLKFVVSPLSYAYYVVGRMRENFVLHVFAGVATAWSVWYGLFRAESAFVALALFCASYSLVYLGYLLRSWHFSRGLRTVGEGK